MDPGVLARDAESSQVLFKIRGDRTARTGLTQRGIPVA